MPTIPQQSERQRQNAILGAGFAPQQAGDIAAGVQTGLPNPNQPITSKAINSNVPSFATPPREDPTQSYLASLQSVTNLINTTTAPQSRAETNQDEVNQSILDRIRGLGQRGVVVEESGELDTSGALAPAQDEAARRLGFEDFADITGQLTNVNNQIQALQNEALKIPLQIQQQAEGLGATQGGFAPIQASRLRENAIQALTLSATAQALQGNVAQAESIAARAVDAAFLKDRIDLGYLRQFQQMNRETLEREDKKTARLLEAQLAERERILNIQREDYSAGLALITGATRNYPTNPQAQIAVNQANRLDPSDPQYLQKVFSLVGEWQSDPIAIRSAMLDEELVRVQISKYSAETKNIISNINSSKVTGVLSPYLRERSVRNIESIADLRDRISHLTTGVGSIASLLPNTIARDFEADVKTLAANIAFSELTAMREASKTGGALGQVSNIELELLKSAVAALDVGQSPVNFRKNLDRIEQSINRWYEAIGENPPESPIGAMSAEQQFLIFANKLGFSKADIMGLSEIYAE